MEHSYKEFGKERSYMKHPTELVLNIRCSGCGQKVHFDGRKQYCLCNKGPIFDSSLVVGKNNDITKWLWP